MSIMSSFSAHYGHWNLVAVLVGVVSWILYRYVAPQGWREWTGAGLVQAFVIALYAEMYGFPLTIYLLTGFLGIDIPLTAYSGHLWATLLGYGMAGAMVEMVIATVFILPGLILLIWGGALSIEHAVPAASPRRALRIRPSPAVPRHHAGCLWAAGALAHADHRGAVASHCVCLCQAGAQGRTRHGQPFWGRLRGVSTQGAHVRTGPQSMETAIQHPRGLMISRPIAPAAVVAP